MGIHFINLKDVDYKLQLEVRNWRNYHHVSQYFQIDYIDLQTHKNWLKTLQKEYPENIAFLIEFKGNHVGLVYFTKINYITKVCDWGMYISSLENRGLGIGDKVLDYSLRYLKQNNFSKVSLEVLKNNHSAIKLYKKKSFKYVENKNQKVQRYQITL